MAYTLPEPHEVVLNDTEMVDYLTDLNALINARAWRTAWEIACGMSELGRYDQHADGWLRKRADFDG